MENLITILNIFTLFFFHRPLYHCHVSQVPSRTLCLLILPETAQQRHIQRAKRQTLLSCLLRQALRLSWPCQHPKPGSFFRLGSFQCYSSLLVGRTPDTTQNTSFESLVIKYSLLNFGNKKKLEKQLSRMVKRFYNKYNIVRHQIFFSLPYPLPFSLNLNQSYFLYCPFHLHYYFYCPYYSLFPCPHYPLSYCKLCKCNHVYKKNSYPSHHNHSSAIFPSLIHLLLHSFSPPNFYYQLLPCLISPTDFVISYHKLSVVLECSRYEGTFLCRNGMLAAPQCLQLQSLLEVQFLYLICILISLKVKYFLQVILLIIGALKIAYSIYCCLSQVCGSNYHSNKKKYLL